MSFDIHYKVSICFIDPTQAHDLVDHSSLWEILQHAVLSFAPKLFFIIRAMHGNSVATVYAYGKASKEFAVTCGVRQGYVLASTLFNLYFDDMILRQLKRANIRVNV